MSIEKHHSEAWARCIMEAGATADIAARAIELAALGGLFDIHRNLEATQRLAMDSNVSDEAIGMRLRNEFAHEQNAEPDPGIGGEPWKKDGVWTTESPTEYLKKKRGET